ncbi:MFS transporter [Flavobacteriaceae bacterium LMO-SS05]
MNDKNKRLTIVLLGAATFLANGDNLAAATLINDIAKDLGLTVSAAALSVTSYMLAFGIFTLIFGPLADRYGKVRVINIAIVGTSIFSILGAMSFNLPSLVFFRAMNGLFGAGILPVSIALVGEMHDNENRQKAIGKVLGIAFLGGAMATAIGGTIAYFGSWRMVYLLYGVAEFILAIVMLKTLVKDKPVTKELKIFASYKIALSNGRFMTKISLIFFMGFAILGCFTYTGITTMERTGYNVFIVGFLLSLYGVGTVYGGRVAPQFRKRLKNGFLVATGFIGFTALSILAFSSNIIILGIGLFGLGITFIFFQSTLLATVQEELSGMKGTVMSLASFNLFLGAALGTQINGQLLENYNSYIIYSSAALLVMVVSIIAAVAIAHYETRKRQAHA